MEFDAERNLVKEYRYKLSDKGAQEYWRRKVLRWLWSRRNDGFTFAAFEECFKNVPEALALWPQLCDEKLIQEI